MKKQLKTLFMMAVLGSAGMPVLAHSVERPYQLIDSGNSSRIVAQAFMRSRAVFLEAILRLQPVTPETTPAVGATTDAEAQQAWEDLKQWLEDNGLFE